MEFCQVCPQNAVKLVREEKSASATLKMCHKMVQLHWKDSNNTYKLK